MIKIVKKYIKIYNIEKILIFLKIIIDLIYINKNIMKFILNLIFFNYCFLLKNSIDFTSPTVPVIITSPPGAAW